jgi:hypothetical protein
LREPVDDAPGIYGSISARRRIVEQLRKLTGVVDREAYLRDVHDYDGCPVMISKIVQPEPSGLIS